MSVSKELIVSIYNQHAKYYDFFVTLYRPIGHERFRLRAVELLQLKQGDFVIDIGCGTGLNFGPLIQKIGPKGRIIGIDISSEMLNRAKVRIRRSKYNNIELVHSDISSYHFSEAINGIISTGVFGYVREQDKVIETISQALISGGRLSIRDIKRPAKWPLWLFKLSLQLSTQFGITESYLDNYTFTRESVERYFQNVSFEEHYGGWLYICTGMAK